jgi:hypothetical protein
MLDFRPLKLEDKELFERFAVCYGYHNIEASFANKYIWGETMNTSICADEHTMYLILNYAGKVFMLPPFFRDCDINFAGPLRNCEEYMMDTAGKFLIKCATKEIKTQIEKDCPRRYRFKPDRNNFEYVYLAEDLSNLKGKKYHAKRNHINRLLAEHTCEYRRYTGSDYNECIALQKKWIHCKDDSPEGCEELEVIKRALLNLDRLGLKCGLLFADGELKAFSIGEAFGDMAIIHIEKADPELRGAYALINREFVRNEWSKMKYINREEDMGIEGLRKAKLSYNPAFLLKKYDCIRNG